MEHLLFALNTTTPVFITMMFGVLFKKLKLFDDAFISKMNQFVFKIALPCLLFKDISSIHIMEAWDTSFVLFCFFATLCSIFISYLFSCFCVEKSAQGEFIQASYRSSAAILGIALIQNIYGTSGMAPLMIVASVPLYNMMAVIVLTVFAPERKPINLSLLKKILIDILKNPIIIAIFLGVIASLLQWNQPIIIQKSISNLSVLATPLGLMAMGASIQKQSIFQKIKPAVIASSLKLVGFVCIFLPLAILCGYTHEKLIAILVMLGSASTVTCFIMAKNMGHKGTLSSQVVLITTLCSAFTLTLSLFILKAFQFI